MKQAFPVVAALMLVACGAPRQPDEDKAKTILAQGAAEAEAGWQKGLSAPPVPNTLEAQVDCAVHWEVWGMAIQEGRLVDPVLIAMPPQLRANAVAGQHHYWSHKTLDRQDRSGNDPGPTLDAYARMKPPAEALFKNAFVGDPGKLEQFVAKLSACRKP